jgi:hypothetical protein
MLTSLLLTSCTDNPFESDSSITGAARSIEGVVQLSGTNDHSGVHVWMEGIDIATTTDVDGNFTFTLPPPSAQNSSGGVEGVFRLYTFMGNYRLQNVRTAVHDGAFVLPNSEIDENGNLLEVLHMQELFSIQTTLDLTRIEADSPRFIVVQVKLQSDVPPVEAYFPRMYAGIEGPVLLYNIRTGAVEIYSTTVTGVEITDNIQIGPVPYFRTLLLNIPKYALRAGEYEIIPYILPKSQYLPPMLLLSLGEEVGAMSENYVFYPFRRERAILTVVPN